ncbi:ribosomal protein S12 methylthiotransferase accessory factor [Oxalobacteraceae bacterium GrIS 1.11]
MEDFSASARLAEIHGALVHQRHGIIKSLMEEAGSTIAPGLFVFNALTVDAAYFRQNCRTRRPDPLNGSGAAFDRATAMWATFGEAMERYAACIYDDAQLRLASADELGDTAIPLDSYILFGDAQYALPDFPFARPNRSLPMHWIAARDLSDGGRERLVPASTVFLGTQIATPREELMQGVSTGFSCADDFQSAVLGGLCEVLERDAFAAMWQLKYSPPRLLIADDTRLLPGVRAALENPNVQLHLWCIATDTGIPVIMAMADNPREGLMACGASAHPHLERAINKAVIESLHGAVWSRRIKDFGKPIPTLEEIDNPTDHFSYYLDPARRANLDFLFDNTGTVSSADLKREQEQEPDLPKMIAHLRHIGYRTLALDVTPADIASLGIVVAKVVVPGLQPLNFGLGLMSEDERRLRKIADVWGIAPFPVLNNAPHPFP